MELYNMITLYSDRFIPVFIRVSVLFSFIPFIGGRTVPITARVGLALALTLLLLPVVTVNVINPMRAIFEAMFIGTALGLTARIILGAVEMAAQLISMEMGFSIAAVFNPQFGEVLSPISLFYSFWVMGVFFMLDIHHYMIEGIVRSFEVSEIHYAGIFESVVKVSSFMFPLAFKIAAPIILVQVILNLGMGFLSRVLPQANIFFISFPLLILMGIMFMLVSLSLTFMVVSQGFIHLKDALMVFVR